MRFSAVFVSAFQKKQPAATFKIPMLSEAKKFSSQEKRIFVVKENLKKIKRVFCIHNYNLVNFFVFYKKIICQKSFFHQVRFSGRAITAAARPGISLCAHVYWITDLWTSCNRQRL